MSNSSLDTTGNEHTNNDNDNTTISFVAADPGNPYNWSRSKKLFIVLCGTLTTLNSTIASSLPSGISEQLAEHFHVTVSEQLVLPNSIFLVGYVLGPFLFAPLSESYGRRWIIVGTYAAYVVFMMATALAPNWAAFNIFRLLTGLFASTPISNTGGLYADIYANPIYRGRSMVWYLFVAAAGPSIAPIPSGYLAIYGWRWTFWFGLILGGACLVPVLFLPETFGPVILMSRAKKIRKENPRTNIYAPLELRPQMSARQFATKVLGRPMRMLFAEPIVTACCLYLSLIYAVLFMLFQAYPLIFPPIYNFTEGETGLAFIPLIVGNFIAMLVCFYWDNYLRSAKAKNKPWSNKEEYQRLPLAIIGGPFFAISMFWLGWGAMPDVHWIVPMLGGLPLGTGFVLIFAGLFNYLVDAYKILSASALGATSISRSTFGVVLPFAAKPMYEKLGVAWACSLLGFLSLLMCLIPLVFIQCGEQLRAGSPMCQELAKEMEQAKQPEKGSDVEKNSNERRQNNRRS